MPRTGTIAADIRDYLEKNGDGAGLQEITEALKQVRRSAVLTPSVRSAIYQHLDERGDGLFVRLGRGRYGLRR
jgi:hypothetical protein